MPLLRQIENGVSEDEQDEPPSGIQPSSDGDDWREEHSAGSEDED